MSACEKCWADAYRREMGDTSKSQGEHYRDLLLERGPQHCTPEERAGQWWDAENKVDRRRSVS